MPLLPGAAPKKKVTIRKDLFPAKTTAIRLVQGDVSRIGLTLRNHSPSSLYLDVDAKVSSNDCLVEIAPGWYFEFPFDATAEIWGVWDASDGQVSIRSFIES